MEPEELFNLYNSNEDSVPLQFKERILSILHHPRFPEILEKLPAGSKAILLGILIRGGVYPALLSTIRSIPPEEFAKARFVRILYSCDWSDFEIATDFVLSEIEMGLQFGYML